MTVGELVLQLLKCPQGVEILLYYDGYPRLEPDYAFLAPSISDGCGEKTPVVILGERDTMYNLDEDDEWGGKPVMLFDVSEEKV